ncbi:spore germination protein [Bacillus smithii]|uniref:spore germination protein n=1 Tax=Bacillus smithii TaxID=1479 RepID=UPI0030C9BAA4
MPSVIGSAQFIHVSNGVVQFGDTAFISPKSATRTSAGAGGFNTGPFIVTYSGLSTNPTVTTSVFDQPLTGNN